jgi:hypothetical protein
MEALAARKLAAKLLTEAHVTEDATLSDEAVRRVLSALVLDERNGKAPSPQRLAEIIQQEPGVLSISTEGISNDDLDTLLLLARKSS